MGLAQTLPVTSYIKMIDIWMIFAMTIPFIEVTLHAFAEQSKKRHKKGGELVRVTPADGSEQSLQEKPIHSQTLGLVTHYLLYFFPLVSLVFAVGFWVNGLLNYYSPKMSQPMYHPNMKSCLSVNTE